MNRCITHECICDLKMDEQREVSKGAWTDLEIKKDCDGYWIVAIGDGIAYLKIDYCPKCGRELETIE